MTIVMCEFCKDNRATHFSHDWDAMICDACEKTPERKPFHTPPGLQCGYRYRNAQFEVAHATSVIQNDEDALKYVYTLRQWGINAKYIEKRDAGQRKWRMLPFQFVNGEIVDV